MRHVRLIVLLLLVAMAVPMARSQAAPAAPPPPKDVLVFNNGDQLQGLLLRATGGNVVFKSDMAGEITVPMSNVKELKTQGNYAVLKQKELPKQAVTEVVGKVEIADQNVTVTPATEAAPVTVAAKDTAYILDEATFTKDVKRHAGLLDNWAGAVNMGTSYTQAFSHGGSLTGGVSLVRQMPILTLFPTRNRTLLNFQENYGTLTSPVLNGDGTVQRDTNGNVVNVSVKTSIMHADAERDEYFSARVYALGTTAFDHNYSQSLDLQQIYGGGIGWTVVQNAKHQLDLKGDVHYEKQLFFDRTLNQNLFGSTFSENYRRNLPHKLVVTQTLQVLPAWTNLHAYSANGSVQVVAPVWKRMSVNFTATDSYLNNPVPGFLKNSFTFTTGLTYSLR